MTTGPTSASVLTPLQRYQAEIDAGVLTPDPAQAEAVHLTQELYLALCQSAVKSRPGGWLSRWLPGRRAATRELVKGLYFWGGVGRGKTHFMNHFHAALPFEDKLRIHFHSFMLRVHAELRRLPDEKDPLKLVADGMARQYRVISFDEFHVSDIADAMLLGRLLEQLFQRGVTLFATSNIAPPGLYHDGLQRERFLPAIASLERNTTVFHLDSPTDYRLRALSQAAIFYSPLGPASEAGMCRCFESLRPEGVQSGITIDISGRPVAARKLADGIAWFDFAAVCETARAASDFIEIGQRFHTVLLSDVPVMDDRARDRVVRFIHLVDELYEQSVNLILSAAAGPEGLYQGKRLEIGFARAQSRLHEMRSLEYLARPHLAEAPA